MLDVVMCRYIYVLKSLNSYEYKKYYDDQWNADNKYLKKILYWYLAPFVRLRVYLFGFL